MEGSLDTKDAITLILATIGTVLGIINYWRSIRDEKVRLRVVPVLAWNFGEGIMSIRSSRKIGELIDRYGIPRMGVEVINLSKFPITLDEVGLCEGNIEKRERAPFFQASTHQNETCPIKLAPRESVILYSQDNHCLDYTFTIQSMAYATTSCDTTQNGRSHALVTWQEIQKQTCKKGLI